MPIEIKDLAGLSEPITKLIEVVSKGLGIVYKPRSIRKEAEAEAYKTELLAKAEAKKIMLEGEAKILLLERAKERLVYQELTRQDNIEEIAEKSIKYLEETVSEQPVDEDWRTRFFNKAQDVSNEELQEVWAKILAKEVSKPGTISFRTLEVISNLSKKEAELFQVACSFATNNSYILKLNGKNSLDEFGLTYDHLMILRDAGLIRDGDNLAIILKVITSSPMNYSIHNIGKDLYQISNLNNKELKEYKFNQIAFTIAGIELCRLININFNGSYLTQLLKDRKQSGYLLSKLRINIVGEKSKNTK